MLKEKRKKHNGILRKKWRNNFTKFHETTLPSHWENRLFLILVLGYIIGEFISIKIASLNYDWIIDWIEEIAFALTEIIPLAIGLGYIYIKREKLHIKSFIQGIGVQIKRWIKFIFHDFIKHIFFLIVLLLMLFVFMILSRSIAEIFFTQNVSQGSSGNTIAWKKDILRNMFTVVCPIIIAPVFEEIFFRKLLTDGLTRFFNNKHFEWHGTEKIRYIASSLISAFLFASVHDGIGDVPLVASYIACALFLQYIHYRSQSLTAPILVHMLFNLTTFLLII
ncbi:CPBP family intramembrane metalloprotease [Apilactobacillus timberlakei]|uniref:CPBP family intramembrane glutamic endopeptidase n=1 Tax=Apilactobacillus timberlakei TaxID=2008380 RepID=UPI00112B5418|nr:type II CAAX endopeptidase family protein [Apilactobacillus timberlakei]TPR13723.1 CPBP family intramembrane metalloprotease [Apilactobacillus timberlakei]